MASLASRPRLPTRRWQVRMAQPGLHSVAEDEILSRTGSASPVRAADGGAIVVLGSVSNETNVELVRQWRSLGLDAALLAPLEAPVKLKSGDVALGRLDVLPTLDGVEAGLLALFLLERRGTRLAQLRRRAADRPRQAAHRPTTRPRRAPPSPHRPSGAARATHRSSLRSSSSPASAAGAATSSSVALAWSSSKRSRRFESGPGFGDTARCCKSSCHCAATTFG